VVAAATGVVIAREFGRSAETDGLLAAYGLSVVVAIAAQAIRIAVMPALARARAEQRLASEFAGFVAALLVLAVPFVLVAELEADRLAALLAGNESPVAKDTAAEALRWMVPASAAQLFAALAASALAAFDDYGTAAFGYAVASVAGLALILLRVEPDGIVAVAWGIALNGAIVLVVPTLALILRAVHTRMPAAAVRPTGEPLSSRLATFGIGAALPLALQLLYVICLAFASRRGTGDATSFVYAYLAASSLVAITAGSLGIVTSVPLSRAELRASAAADHVVATSWVVLVIVGGAAGAFALAGGHVVESVLGSAYAGDIGADLGRLVVAFSPWVVASIGVTVTFPLAFVTGRARGLPLIALGVLLVQVPVAWLAVRWLGLGGLALALAATTLIVVIILLSELEALPAAARPLMTAALVVAGLTLAAFIPPAVVLGALPSAVLGLGLYAVLIALVRPPGLRLGWRYLRALG
jgi:hypothetical protein